MILTDEMIEQLKVKARKIDKKGCIVLEYDAFENFYEIHVEAKERFDFKKMLDKN